MTGSRTVGVAVGVSLVAMLPVLLVGAMAVMLQEDLAFGEAQLGAAVAAHFASGALAAAPAGWLAERIGPRITVWFGLACCMSSLVGIAWLAASWVSLAALLALAGIGITMAQLGVNVLLVRGVVAARQGLAFGVSQAALPLSALIAGLSVPTIGVTLGWRWAFILAAVLAPIAAASMPAGGARPSGRARTSAANLRVGVLLLVFTLGMALASAGANATAVFVAASSVNQGFTPADAGLLLAWASFVAVAVRVTAGWLVDRIGRGALILAAGLIGIGAVGQTGLAFATHPALIFFFATLALGGGWGWPGLFFLAVSRSNPVAPGTALGVVYVGGMTGAMTGPFVFGYLASELSFTAAWLAVAAMAVFGASTMLWGRRIPFTRRLTRCL